jgi:hypothetical protein
VDRTRVMLAWLPRMLREILERAAETMRMDVVCVLSGDDDLEAALLRCRPHAIVLGMPGVSRDSLAYTLLAADGKLCIMTVSGSGRHATVHRTNAPPMRLDNLSPRDLLGTLDALVGAARTFP